MQTIRFETAVKVYDQFSFETFRSETLIEIHHIPVVHLHKINLHPFNSPVSIDIKNVLHIVP